MCGIIGLFLKDDALAPQLGALATEMLVEMTDRGPDSAGIAVYAADADAEGRTMRLFKDVGLPQEVADRIGLPQMAGTHAIGHTRMATESAVTTAGAHPFVAGTDLCLVHNGSLSNYFGLRRMLRRRGRSFETENDSEVAAEYLAWKLAEGLSLEQALTAAHADLDGFYTLCIGTSDGFAVTRDGFGCKPATLAETEDWVAMASEYRAIAHLPGAETARVWEPEPGEVYVWTRADLAAEAAA